MEISYRIDRDNRLVEVGGDWDAFALENETPAVRRDAVLGRSLLDFVAGTETRHLHELLLERARRGIPLRRMSFRCDSLDLRRYMEMEIASPDGAVVEYRCRLLRVIGLLRLVAAARDRFAGRDHRAVGGGVEACLDHVAEAGIHRKTENTQQRNQRHRDDDTDRSPLPSSACHCCFHCFPRTRFFI